MAKAKRTYTVNSEIVNFEGKTFATIKEAKEAITAAITDKNILGTDNKSIGSIDGILDNVNVNTTNIRIELGEVKFGRTTKTDEGKKIDSEKKTSKVTVKEEDEAEDPNEAKTKFFSKDEIEEITTAVKESIDNETDEDED